MSTGTFILIPFLLVCTLPVCAPAGEAKQLLICRHALVDKGICKSGQVLAHTFELCNTGAAALNIVSVDGGCACARLAINTRQLLPGETALLTVEIATLAQPPGEHRWPVRVRYCRTNAEDDPQAHGSCELVLMARIVQEIRIEPTRLAISTTGAGTYHFTITDGRTRPMTIHKGMSASPFVAVQVERVQASQHRIVLRLAEQMPPGEHDATVSLWTDDADYRELRLPVQVVRRSANSVAVSPEELVLPVGGTQPPSQMVQLRSLRDRPVRIAAVQSDHAAVRWKYPQEAGHISAVRVSLDTQVAPPAGQALLRIRLAEPVEETLLLPVRWGVAPPPP